MQQMSNTKEFEQKALAVIPGFQSNLRLPLFGRSFCFIRGEGARLWDVDGKEYVDYVISAGAGVLGHGNPFFINALKDQLHQLYYSFCGGSWTPAEIALAGKFVEYVPCADKVRFLLSGTEAVQLVLRLARAYTGRRLFIRFEGHYHGWMDNVLGGVVNPDPAFRPHPLEADDIRQTLGRDAAAYEQSFLVPWNNLDALDRVLKKYGDEIALILMEPILVNNGCCAPKPGYMEGVRKLCDQHGVLLCFDEVITGFRVGLAGAQGLLNVTPDLATYGKAFAGGIPTSAVAGRKEIMDQLYHRKVIGAGTFNGYPFGMAAALATVEILEKDDGAFYGRTAEKQARLVQGLTETARRRNIPLMLQGPTGAVGVLFTEKDVISDVRELQQTDLNRLSRFSELMLDEGVLMAGGRLYISEGLSQRDIDRTLECADRVMGRL